jgi:hypothetical protein
MAKQVPNNDDLFPLPKNIASVGKEIKLDDVNKIALRRGKVRELSRMGYAPAQIVLILEKGIRVGKNDVVQVPISEGIVKDDIEYIRQEDAAISVDFTEKRAELLDKLNFLYQRAVLEYTNAKGPVKNNFLNTSLSVLSKIIDIEGIKQADAIDVNINAQAKLSKYVAEVHSLNKEDKDALIETINTILTKREYGTTEGLGIPDETPTIRTSPTDDEGILE